LCFRITCSWNECFIGVQSFRRLSVKTCPTFAANEQKGATLRASILSVCPWSVFIQCAVRYSHYVAIVAIDSRRSQIGSSRRFARTRSIAIHQVSLLSHAACASMSTTTTTTTTTRDRGDRFGPMEWAQ